MTDNTSKEYYSVYWHDTDMHGQLSFAALSRYLQEIAWINAEKLGFGYNQAIELGQAWVLVRQLIKMNRMPLWRDKITIETWPRGKDVFFAHRDYQLRSENGEILGGVSSSWMIIDFKTRRPHKLEIFNNGQLNLVDKQALDETAGKILFKEEGEQIDSRTVKFSDMDFNGHVNNSKYVEWVMDALNLYGEVGKYCSLHINFHAEAKLGEPVNIYMIKKEDKILVKATNKADKNIFIVELT